MDVDGPSTYATKSTHLPFSTHFIEDTVRSVYVLHRRLMGPVVAWRC
jgi:hypothetical protein